MTQCPRCQHENPPQSRFCFECGARLALICGDCGTPLPAGVKFCNQCGSPVGAESTAESRFAPLQSYIPTHLAERILKSKSALEGERKQVTVLFADLRGSMELLADRDPEEARKLLDPVLERMMEAVHRYEGTVNQVMGDGIMALFGAPVAHEDHAVRACYAALRMQEAVRRHAEEVRRAAGVPIQIRVGLNSGEVVVRSIGSDLRMDYTAVGHTTHLAARMEQATTPGSILVTGNTLRLAEGYVQVTTLGPIAIKGLADPVEAYEVTGASLVRSRLQASAARGLTRFVGRDTELELLRQTLERARGGSGQVVSVVGEPGVGKSRLYWEFTRSHHAREWLVVESASVSYGKATAYWPAVELLRAYFQIEPRDDARKIREKVTGKVLALDRALEAALPALVWLLDVPVEDAGWQALDPPQRRLRTLDAVKRLLLRESQVQPLLVVFEDLHWIDAETQALLDSLVESLPTARLVLLVNYRPEYQHGWGSKTYYRQLRIDPLPPESAEELLRVLLGEDPALEPLKALLVERTEGNPFFLEESVQTLVETGGLSGERGAYRLAKPLPGIQVPATVQAVLAARIDRLPAEEKQLLQSAAVIGKDVPLPLLQAIADLSEDALRRALARCRAAELLYETALFPEPEYTFKHALTHEVAYQSLLQDRQRALHTRIVEVLERLHAGRLAEQVERLAHHALRGGVLDKAALYLPEAGKKALARSANREAVGFFEQALDALGRLPETRETLSDILDVRLALGSALIALKGAAAPEVEASYARAYAACSRLDEAERLFPAVWGLWYVHYSRGHYRAAVDMGERLLAVAGQRNDSVLRLEAHHTLWATLLGMGDLLASREHSAQGLALYDPEVDRGTTYLYGNHDPGVCCRSFSSWALWELGFPDQALSRMQESTRLARELGHPITLASALFFEACLHQFRGDLDAAEDRAETLRALAQAQGFGLWIQLGGMLSASLDVERGRHADGIAQLRVRLPALGGWRFMLGLCALADAHRRAREPEKGLEVLAEGLATAERNAIGFRLPEVYRLQGELLALQAGRLTAEAEGSLRRALNLARTRREQALELRAATSYTGRLREAGRCDEARVLLGDVYGNFTEGLATRDLRDARAILDSL